MASVVCKKCGTTIDDGVNFCPVCGEAQKLEPPIPLICEDCGQAIPDGNTFCPNCGCPVATTPKRSKEIPSSKAPKSKRIGKKSKARRSAVMLTLVLTVVIVVGVVAGSFYYRINASLTQADNLYNAGEYYQAQLIYDSIQNSSRAVDGSNKCKYMLGKAAMKNKFWQAAIDHFQSISADNYEDINDLIKQCNEELKREAASDYDFLEDLENIMRARLNAGITTPEKKTIESEVTILSKYKDRKSFYDNSLGIKAEKIYSIFVAQKNAVISTNLNSSYIVDHSYQQIRYWQHYVDLIDELRYLYNHYDFMKNDNELIDAYIRKYTVGDSAAKITYNTLRKISDNITLSLDEAGLWKRDGNDRSYMLIHNDTGNTITVKFYYSVYTKDRAKFLYESTYLAENIPSYKDYYIYIPENRLYDGYGESTVFTEWEVLKIS